MKRLALALTVILTMAGLTMPTAPALAAPAGVTPARVTPARVTPAVAAPARAVPARATSARSARSARSAGATPRQRTGGSCDAVTGAYQLPGADGISPAAWTGNGLTVPACGPIPNDGGPTSFVNPYPGSLWTPGYQCVEFSERYLYYRYGVTMDMPTNGDQIAAHYAARYPGLFTVVPNGTPHRAPATGDVLSMSADPGFDSWAGGHTAVVQASSVNAAGDGTVTIVEQNAVPGGVEVLPVRDWYVTYTGFPYMVWLTTARVVVKTTARFVVTTPSLPAAEPTRRYSASLSATGGTGPYRWALTQGTLPEGLALSETGVLAGTPTASGPGGGDDAGDWPVTLTVTSARGETVVASLNLMVGQPPEDYYCLLITAGASCSVYSPMRGYSPM